jgi:hypothetical protein
MQIMTKKLFDRLFPARKKARRRTKFLTLESLESRELFSVSPGPFANLSGDQPAQVSTVTSRLSFQDVESNNTLATANNVGTASAGASSALIYGHIGNRIGRVVDSQDWYKIEVRGQTDATFTLSSMTRDLDLYLFNSQGREVTRSNNSGTRVDAIRRTLDPGTYFVQVRQFSSNVSIYTLRMNLNVQAAPEQPVTPTGADVEPNNERTQASNIGLFTAGTNTRTIAGNVGSTVAGSVDSQDWYRFEVAGRTAAQLRLTGLTQDLDLYLYNSSGAEINSSSNGGSDDDTITTTLEPGSYFVQIRQYSGSSSAYSLRMNMEVQAPTPPNPRLQATHLGDLPRFGQTWRSQPSGQISNSTREIYYSFNNNSSRRVQLDLRSISADLDIELQNADGVVVARSTNSGTARDLIATSITPGRWFIRVYQGTASANSRFDLRVASLS